MLQFLNHVPPWRLLNGSSTYKTIECNNGTVLSLFQIEAEWYPPALQQPSKPEPFPVTMCRNTWQGCLIQFHMSSLPSMIIEASASVDCKYIHRLCLQLGTYLTKSNIICYVYIYIFAPRESFFITNVVLFVLLQIALYPSRARQRLNNFCMKT